MSTIPFLLVCIVYFKSSIQSTCSFTPNSRPLRVITTSCAPFSFGEEGRTGITMWLWEQVTNDPNFLDTNCTTEEVVTVKDFGKALESISSGENDVLLSCATITPERSQVLDFTNPYFQGNFGMVLSRKKLRRTVTFSTWSPVMVRLVTVLLVTCTVLLAISHLFYLVELRGAQGYFTGVWNSMWWSTVTATTVGYGDFVPVTRTGRVVAIAWMLITVCIMSYFTATLTSLVTLDAIETGAININNLFDLRNHGEVGYQHGTTAAEVLDFAGVPKKPFSEIEDALQELVHGERLFAYVSDGPLLQYLIAAKAVPILDTTDDIFVQIDAGMPPYYLGLVLQKGSQLTPILSQAIRRTQRDGLHAEIAKYLNTSITEKSKHISTSLDKWTLLYLSICTFLCLGYIAALFCLKRWFSTNEDDTGRGLSLKLRKDKEPRSADPNKLLGFLKSGPHSSPKPKTNRKRIIGGTTRIPPTTAEGHLNPPLRVAPKTGGGGSTAAWSISGEGTKLTKDIGAASPPTLSTTVTSPAAPSPDKKIDAGRLSVAIPAQSEGDQRSFSGSGVFDLNQMDSLRRFSAMLSQSRSRLQEQGGTGRKPPKRSTMNSGETKLENMEGDMREVSENLEVILFALEHLIERADTAHPQQQEILQRIIRGQKGENAMQRRTSLNPLAAINSTKRNARRNSITASALPASGNHNVNNMKQPPKLLTPSTTSGALDDEMSPIDVLDSP